MRDSGASQGVVTLKQVGQVLRGGWVIVLTCMALGVALSGVLAVAVPAAYTSTSAVSISPNVGTGSSSPKDISTATESAIASSTAVADRAAPLLKWPGAASKLLDHVSVASPLDSQVLQISYTGSTPADAAAGANAFATAYLAYRTDTAQAGLQVRIDRIGQQISDLQKALNAKTPILTDPKSTSAQKTEARLQQSSLGRQISQLQDQQAVISTTTINAGHLVNKGLLPLGPDLPLPIFLLGGLLLGLVLGVTITMLRNLGDTTVRDAGYIEERFTVPVLASVPEQVSSPSGSTAFGVLTDLGGREADAYRSLAAKMTVGTTPSCRRLLLVAASDLHASTTPVGLAVILAAQGRRVLLLGSREAMTNACRLVSPDDAIAEDSAEDSAEGLQELLHTGGPRLVSFGDELSLVATLRSQGDEQLGSMLEEIDILLIDGINVDLASTPLTLARLADEALVVVRAGETHIPDIRESLHGLRQVALPVEGIVLLVPTQPRRSRGEERGARRTPSTPQSDSVASRSQG